MPIAVQMFFEGATIEQYDEVIKLMGLHPGGAGPVGSLAHWAGPAPGGLRVVDIWKSQAEFEAFVQNSIAPMTAKVGMKPPASTEFFEVHNHFTAG
jgi:hypothetical protein